MRSNWNTILPILGVIFVTSFGCSTPAPSSPVAPAQSEAATAVSDRLAPEPVVEPAPIVGCNAVAGLISKNLRVGMNGSELRDALGRADFVYREHRVTFNHHLTLPKKGEMTTQFGCIDEPVAKLDVELGEGEGPVPTVRFFFRMKGSEAPTLAAFLSSPDAELLEFSRVEQAAKKSRDEELMGSLG